MITAKDLSKLDWDETTSLIRRLQNRLERIPIDQRNTDLKNRADLIRSLINLIYSAFVSSGVQNNLPETMKTFAAFIEFADESISAFESEYVVNK